MVVFARAHPSTCGKKTIFEVPRKLSKPGFYYNMNGAWKTPCMACNTFLKISLGSELSAASEGVDRSKIAESESRQLD